ncbi:MAG: hypothetical protein JNL73_18630 [Anaerolineales bacterium]|nr:hypothetical protein [Anaerolineales bacterium]
MPAEAPLLREVLTRENMLDLGARRRVVDQAIVLFESFYVHRPQKEAMHAVIPIQRLRLLRAALEALPDDTPAEHLSPDLAFHREMVAIFAAWRDLHTSYLLPRPYSQYLAFLPFMVEACQDEGRTGYVVTRLIGQPRPTDFVAGVELLNWNGVPIARAIERNGEGQAGSNPDAHVARGLYALTMRPLARSLPPDEDWVSVTYRNRRGTIREARFEWRALDLTQDDTGPVGELAGVVRYRDVPDFGIDLQAALIQNARRHFFQSAPRKAAGRAARAAGPQILDTALPSVFRAYALPGTRFGYLRIFSFDVVSADGFVDACCDLLDRLPPDGLILDIRGNPGGNILAAEKLLQLFTPRTIRPEALQFINSPGTLALCERHAQGTQPGLGLGAWVASIRESVQTGAPYSNAVPITPEPDANAIGQRYYGPVVLITDPLCYSAADIFAAGFQDHDLGAILGVGGRTGAGGANVWQHGLLEQLLHGADETGLAPLPLDLGMTVAIRRTLRVGENAGDVLEDFGVAPAGLYAMTRRDVLGSNEDLLAEAVRQLEALTLTRPARTLRLASPQIEAGMLTLTLTTGNLKRVDLWLDHRPWQSLDVQDGEVVVTGRAPGSSPRRVRALGFAATTTSEPVAVASARL